MWQTFRKEERQSNATSGILDKSSKSETTTKRKKPSEKYIKTTKATKSMNKTRGKDAEATKRPNKLPLPTKQYFCFASEYLAQLAEEEQEEKVAGSPEEGFKIPSRRKMQVVSGQETVREKEPVAMEVYRHSFDRKKPNLRTIWESPFEY